nr:MAG TPA: hypothetical protein [Caudoviricetes sp.]
MIYCQYTRFVIVCQSRFVNYLLIFVHVMCIL